MISSLYLLSCQGAKILKMCVSAIMISVDGVIVAVFVLLEDRCISFLLNLLWVQT